MDVVDLRPPTWQVNLGTAMLSIGLLPMGKVLILAAWVLYWTRVRE